MNASRPDYGLRRITPDARTGETLVLDPAIQTRIGRSATCELRVNDHTVSRKHALISHEPSGQWLVYDMNSQNGTYVNGTRIAAGTVLQPGDRIRLGLTGPAFAFERQHLGGKAAERRGPTTFRVSAILPVLTQGKPRPVKREHAWLGIVSIVTALTLTGFAKNPSLAGAPSQLVVAAYFLYLTLPEMGRMTGRSKPWWELLPWVAIVVCLTSAATEIATHLQPLVDTRLQPLVRASIQEGGTTIALVVVMLLSPRLRSPWVGIRDPLDGIVVGVASASSFAFGDASVCLATHRTCTFPGLAEIIGDIAGAVAFAGFLGSSIGLAATVHSIGLKLLYITSAFAITTMLHTLALLSAGNVAVLLPVRVLSFLLLIGAISRARQDAGLSRPLNRRLQVRES